MVVKCVVHQLYELLSEWFWVSQAAVSRSIPWGGGSKTSRRHLTSFRPLYKQVSASTLAERLNFRLKKKKKKDKVEIVCVCHQISWNKEGIHIHVSWMCHRQTQFASVSGSLCVNIKLLYLCCLTVCWECWTNVAHQVMSVW